MQNQICHRLLEMQAAQAPGRVAVICKDQQLTFSQLNTRANQLARFLRAMGVGPEVLVGVYLERSLEVAVAIYAVLKAGGAYLPLDPEYPQDRLTFMAENAQTEILLTQERLSSSLPKYQGRVISLDTAWPSIAHQSETDLNDTVQGEALAYVIYTSGSTGQPKGAMLTHANLSHYVCALQAELGVTHEDVYLHTASMAFSSSRRQLMLPLSQGATVVMATADQRKDPLALFSLVKQRGVTIMDAVPSFWRTATHLLASLEPEVRRNLLDNRLRLILSASEPLLSDVPRTWTHEFRHPAQHIHMYGQTETSGIVSLYRIPVENDESIKPVPVGRPIANIQIHLLGSDGQPVKVGEPGEIHIGGAGVGRGYLRHPELTAAKFIPDPFSSRQGERLYKTGDWARHLPDGNLECLGRQDHQIKIRGFRVELGEIRAVLARHPRVRETAVIVREDVSDEKCLVAYIVPHQVQQTTTEELRRFLKQNLPDYMVPAFFVLLERLPYAPNGKVDLHALPAPDQSQPDRSSTYIAPCSRIEKQIADIYAQVLSLERIGITDDFFELGGDSLLAVRAMNRVQKLIGRQLPLVLIFEAPTIAQLVELLEKAYVVDWEHDKGRPDDKNVTQVRTASASARIDPIRVLPRVRQCAK